MGARGERSEAEDGESSLCGRMAIVQRLDVREDGPLMATESLECRQVHRTVLMMADGDDQRIHGMGSIDSAERDAVLVLDLRRIRPRIADDDLDPPLLQLLHEVRHLAVPDIGAVLLEGDAQDADTAARDIDAVLEHQADDVAGRIARHVVIDPSAGEDHLRMVSHLLRLMREVVGIDPDTVSTDHPRSEGEEVPLAPRRFEHLDGINPESGEDDGELVHEGDVQVPLTVLDDLCRLGHPQATGLPRPCGDDAGIETIDRVSDLGGAAAGDLPDGRQGVDLVAWDDPLGAIAAIEPLVEPESGGPLEDRDADLLGASRVNGRFIDHDRACLERGPDGLTRLDEGGEIGPVGPIDGGRDGHDKDPAFAQSRPVTRVFEVARRTQLFAAHLECAILAGAKLGDASLVDIEPEDRAVLPELDGQRESNIPEADDRDLAVIDVHLINFFNTFTIVRWES
jgi:hypothetical protein